MKTMGGRTQKTYGYDGLVFSLDVDNSAVVGDDIEFILTLDEEATISTVQVDMWHGTTEDGTLLLKVGEETCQEFPYGFSYRGYNIIDCSSNSPSNTVSFSLTTQAEDDYLTVYGVIVDTGSSSPASFDYWFEDGRIVTNADWDYLTDCASQGSMTYYEVTLEESETAGEYYVSHACEDEDDLYLSQDALAESLYDSTYPAKFANAAANLPKVSLALTPYPGAPDGYYYSVID